MPLVLLVSDFSIVTGTFNGFSVSLTTRVTFIALLSESTSSVMSSNISMLILPFSYSTPSSIVFHFPPSPDS